MSDVIARVSIGVLLLAIVASASATPPGFDYGDDAYVTRLVAAIEEEIQHFAGLERQANETQRVVIRASIDLRIIAAELLGQGDAAGDEGAISVLHGLHIAEGRADLDELMIGIHRAFDRKRKEAGADPAAPDLALDAVRRFNAAAVDHADAVRTIEVAALDAALAKIFAPLGEAVELHLGVTPVTGWPAPANAPGDTVPVENRCDALTARLEAVTLDDETRATLASIIEFLRRGARFDHLHAAVDDGLAFTADAVAFVETLDRVRWPHDDTRAAYMTHVRRAAALYAEPASRAEAVELLARLTLTARAIDAIDGLAAAGVDRSPLVQALRTANAVDAAGAFAHPPAGLRRLVLVLDRMIAYRDFDDSDVPRPLRPLLERLETQYRKSEAALLDRLETLLADGGASTDPGLVSLIADHLHRLEDLERVRALPTWVTRMGAMHPPAASALDARLRKVASQLASPQRRPDALRALTRLAEDLDRFDPLPYEAELTSRGGRTIELTGGRTDDLESVVRDAKRKWVEAWTRGIDEGPERARLVVLHELLTAMAVADARLAREPSFSALARWSGWEVREETIGALPSQLISRLKLATAAVLDGRDGEAAGQLARLERLSPATIFVASVDEAIGAALRATPPGAAATIGRLMYPPAPDAWKLDARIALARLSRVAFEATLAEDEARRVDAARMRKHERTLLDLLAPPS